MSHSGQTRGDEGAENHNNERLTKAMQDPEHRTSARDQTEDPGVPGLDDVDNK